MVQINVLFGTFTTISNSFLYYIIINADYQMLVILKQDILNQYLLLKNLP